MADKILRVPLGEIAEIVIGQSPPGGSYNHNGVGAPLLNGPTEFGARHPTPVLWTTEPTRFSRAGDLLFCVRGSTTGRMNWSDRDYAIGHGIAAIRTKSDNFDTKYTYIVIYGDLNCLLALTSGSVFPNLSRDDFLGFKLPWPDRQRRQAVAFILGSLDDKIDLNRRMNETLEAIARAIFRSWFVDFDPVRAKAAGRSPHGMDEQTAGLFPDSFEDSPQGPIPTGWKIGRLDEVAEIVMGSSPPGDTYNEDGLGTPLANGPVEFGDFFAVKRKWTTSPGRLSQPRDLIFCVRGSTTGRRVIADDMYCLGRGVCSIRARENVWVYVRQLIDQGPTRLSSNVTGSVFPNLNGPDLKSFPVVVPQSQLVSRYETKNAPLFDLVWRNVKQRETLATLRDALLPKLLSGEIRVKDAEKFAEAQT